MTKEELENLSVKELVIRLNGINKRLDITTMTANKELEELTAEYNLIVRELWRRIPSVKDDVNLEPKVLKKIR